MRAFCSFAVLGVALCGQAIHATVIIPAEFRVSRRFVLIAYGRHRRSSAVGDGRRRIDSIVTVDVMSWFKVGTKARFRSSSPAARSAEYRQVMIGAPVFKPGDEAFLFLKSQAQGCRVFGLNQGVFRVSVDQRGVRKVVALLLASGTDQKLAPRGGESAAAGARWFGRRDRTAMAAGRAGVR
jgi:hypothetical protein